MKGHWSRTCRTPEHLAKLYQASMKRIANNVETNNVETNLIFQEDDVETHKNDNVNELNYINGFDVMTHLEVTDFFENQD